MAGLEIMRPRTEGTDEPTQATEKPTLADITDKLQTVAVMFATLSDQFTKLGEAQYILVELLRDYDLDYPDITDDE